MSDNQLTTRPLCPICKVTELTAEEEEMKPISCWYCKAKRIIELKQRLGDDLPFPDPIKHGRSDVDLSKYEEKKAQPMPTPSEADVSDAQRATSSTQIKNINKNFSQEEKDHFKRNFGIDLDNTPAQTDIIVFGSDERTYLKFTAPVPINSKVQTEIKQLLEAALSQVGAMILYGRHFKDIIDKYKQNTPGLQ